MGGSIAPPTGTEKDRNDKLPEICEDMIQRIRAPLSTKDGGLTKGFQRHKLVNMSKNSSI